ncbi:hypothetical protein CMQ_7663 [Grosmannia clavigera kw1407]|uniref:Uncharacterized protein n=1 Tax=Grosmannia clavigera (strain kw1407 / UAMH 11150) TaxID=655863 RepID=F0XQI0_GROCL|nr:uncharacterized protein CMQ_7663 [Grosmannia clavigera kw1407]EFX00661.1 hypothetical protein CMQ_7663 [Grosmannia clavigera kw1407]
MTDAQVPKIQPWKALKTLSEDSNPDLNKLQKFRSGDDTSGNSGSSVSRPIYRKTAHETEEDGSATENLTSPEE